MQHTINKATDNIDAKFGIEKQDRDAKSEKRSGTPISVFPSKNHKSETKHSAGHRKSEEDGLSPVDSGNSYRMITETQLN